MPAEYKVLITTSGIGQTLGDFTKNANPSLIRLSKKPILSHIVDNYSKDIEIVVTLGYFGNLVKEYLQIAYPDRRFNFVEVKNYEGPGSSLLNSVLQAKGQLQCPFIFNSGDTVVMESVGDALTENWCGGFKGKPSNSYRSFVELDEKILSFKDKGSTDFDYLHIGLVGIKDYEKFWETAEKLYAQSPDDSVLGDVPVLNELIKQGTVFKPKEFKTWLDVGNLEALYETRNRLGDSLVNLDKPNEATYIIDESHVIKFMEDSQGVKNLVKRAEVLSALVPKIENQIGHFFRYSYVRGRLYSRTVNPPNFAIFLDWAKQFLWKPVSVDREEFQKKCLDFYKEKTLKRLEDFYRLTGISDGPTQINGYSIPALAELIQQVDFKSLSDGQAFVIHGDLILDNIIQTKDSFVLLDWRKDFAGIIEAGDIYYDLAKLNHNLIVSHDLIFNNQFSVKIRGNVVSCDILRSENLASCQKVLWDYVHKNGFDLSKVRLLTAIAWLNMAPLHHHPYNYFLYFFGKLNLWKELNNI